MQSRDPCHCRIGKEGAAVDPGQRRARRTAAAASCPSQASRRGRSSVRQSRYVGVGVASAHAGGVGAPEEAADDQVSWGEGRCTWVIVR
jgi:hypothetical protein